MMKTERIICHNIIINIKETILYKKKVCYNLNYKYRIYLWKKIRNCNKLLSLKMVGYNKIIH
jgi:hypothetical protein